MERKVPSGIASRTASLVHAALRVDTTGSFPKRSFRRKFSVHQRRFLLACRTCSLLRYPAAWITSRELRAAATVASRGPIQELDPFRTPGSLLCSDPSCYSLIVSVELAVSTPPQPHSHTTTCDI